MVAPTARFFTAERRQCIQARWPAERGVTRWVRGGISSIIGWCLAAGKLKMEFCNQGSNSASARLAKTRRIVLAAGPSNHRFCRVSPPAPKPDLENFRSRVKFRARSPPNCCSQSKFAEPRTTKIRRLPHHRAQQRNSNKGKIFWGQQRKPNNTTTISRLGAEGPAHSEGGIIVMRNAQTKQANAQGNCSDRITWSEWGFRCNGARQGSH